MYLLIGKSFIYLKELIKFKIFSFKILKFKKQNSLNFFIFFSLILKTEEYKLANFIFYRDAFFLFFLVFNHW